MNKKVLKVIVPILIVIELCFIFLSYKSFSNKEINTLTETSIVDKNRFAIFYQTENGYEEYTESNTFPVGYLLNINESKCTDNSGKELESLVGILSQYGNSITVTSNKTLYCYLYFDNLVFMKALTTENSSETSLFSEYKSNIKNVYFVNNISKEANKIKSWDLSDIEMGAKSGSVIAWLEKNETDNSKYDLYIGANGKILVLNLSYAFADFSALETVDFSNLDTSMTTDMGYMFYLSNELTNLVGISNWNTSSVNNMTYMFNSASSITSLDLSKWDTSSVTNMSHMFQGAINLDSLGDISNWNISNVTNMGSMFQSASSITSLNLSGWDTSKVNDMSWMFYYANGLKTLDMSNASFTQTTSYSKMFGESGTLNKDSRVPETIEITVKDSDQASWIRLRLDESIGSGKGTIYTKN